MGVKRNLLFLENWQNIGRKYVKRKEEKQFFFVFYKPYASKTVILCSESYVNYCFLLDTWHWAYAIPSWDGVTW